MNAMTGYRGQRIPASSAYLSEVPPNLTIKTDTTVERVVFEADKAVGIDVPGRRSGFCHDIPLSCTGLLAKTRNSLR